MGLFGTSPKDIEKWEQQGKTDKIIGSLKHKNYLVRKAAVMALGNLKEISAFKQVTEALKDGTPDVSIEAIATLGKFGTKEAFEVLMGHYENNSLRFDYVSEALLNIHLRECYIYLFTITANKGIRNNKDLTDAKYLLQIKDTSYVADLGPFFEKAPSWDIILYAIMLLKEINNPAAMKVLKPLLLHQEAEIRKNTALAMSALGETKWAKLVKGKSGDDMEKIVKDGDPFLLNKMMEHIGTSHTQTSKYIEAIIKSGNKDLCYQASEIIFEKDKYSVMRFIDLFSIGENKKIISYLKNSILTTSSDNRKSIAETLEKLGDTSLKEIIDGTTDDYYRLVMADYPGIHKFIIRQMKENSKYGSKPFVETVIKIASNDYTKIKNWQNISDIIENSHTDSEHRDHEDIGPSNSDCHSDYSNYHHTDKGVSMDFTDEQKIMLSRIKMLDSLPGKEINDEFISKCIDSKDTGLLTDLLQKYEIKSPGLFKKLLVFYRNSQDKQFRKLVDKLLFKPEAENIDFIIQMLEESKSWVFDINLLSSLGKGALDNTRLTDAFISNCINNKDNANLSALLAKTEIRSMKAIEELTRYCYSSKNDELWQTVEKLLFRKDEEHIKLIVKLLNDLYSWKIHKEQLLSLGDEMAGLYATLVPENCSMDNCKLVMDVLAELGTEKAMNVLRCFLFQKDIKIRGEAYRILLAKGESWYATAEDKNKVLVETRDSRLVFAFKHMYHKVLPEFKERFLNNLYEFADEEILDLVIGDYEEWDWPYVVKIAAKVKNKRSTKFLEEVLCSTYTGALRVAAAEALFERGDDRWKGKITGEDSDFVVLIQSLDENIIRELINCKENDLEMMIEAFGQSGSPIAYETLMAFSNRGDFWQWKKLYKALALVKDKRAIPMLIEKLYDNDPEERKKVAEALSEIDAPYWKEIFTGNDSDYTRLANFPNKETIAMLTTLLENRNVKRRKQAAEALVYIASKDFNSVASILKENQHKISQKHQDSTSHYDKWATTRSGDCHSDNTTHTDSGIGVQIPEDLKL